MMNPARFSRLPPTSAHQRPEAPGLAVLLAPGRRVHHGGAGGWPLRLHHVGERDLHDPPARADGATSSTSTARNPVTTSRRGAPITTRGSSSSGRRCRSRSCSRCSPGGSRASSRFARPRRTLTKSTLRRKNGSGFSSTRTVTRTTFFTFPSGQKVRAVISSVDVVHSFGLPAFRTKVDAVPGRYTELWFQATQTGEFPVFCDQYCGTGHSAMITKVVVHDQADFDKWLVEAGNKMDSMPPVELGEKMYNQQGCAGCHSLDGTIKTGPSWKGVFGSTESLSDGSTVQRRRELHQAIDHGAPSGNR